eukprot:9502321-Pyramimonas_sp.AAC.1
MGLQSVIRANLHTVFSNTVSGAFPPFTKVYSSEGPMNGQTNVGVRAKSGLIDAGMLSRSGVSS